MDEKDKKGIFFKNMDESRKYIHMSWKIGVISFIILVSLLIIKTFDVFYNDYITVVFMLSFVLSLFLFLYSNFENNLINANVRRKICLEIGKCMRGGCKANFSTCLDHSEYGVWVCIYYESQIKKPIEEMLGIIGDKEKDI